MVHELASGAALVSEIGAMYGPHAVFETSLINQVLAQLPLDSVVMAGAVFGIFTVAYAAHQAGHQHVLRLTPVRFDALRREATLESEDEITQTWTLTWHLAASVRRSHPDLPKTAQLEVHLHTIYNHEMFTLYLVSDPPDSGEAPANLYELRTDVEIDIRN